MELKIDLSALNALQAAPQRIEAAKEIALNRCAEIALQAKAREIDKTYRRPIPRNKSGTPKWNRSGAWQGGQRVESRNGERTVYTTGPAEKYEPRLANLPRSRDGVDRQNAAAQNAAQKIESQMQPVFENEIENALR